jgi:hypothetical protein
MVGGQSQGSLGFNADCCFRSRSALGDLPELGVGHCGWWPRTLYLKRFGSVTVLNGHIRQVMQKIEGHVTFYTAR